MRPWFIVALIAVVAALALEAGLDPALPWLGPQLDWWLHPVPLALHDGGLGPHRLTFYFTPAREGELAIAVMARFRLLDGARLLARSPPGDWKQPLRLQVPARPLRVEAEHPRWLPALGLGGEAAPQEVEAESAGVRSPARLAPSFYDGHGLLDPSRRPLGAARWALAGSALALVLLLALRLALRPTTRAIAEVPRPRLVAAIVAAHALLAGWNLGRFPVDRGLDAAGHIEYARLIAEEGRIPEPDRGFQTYHPPLYHVLGALALRAIGDERSLQALSTLAGIALVLLVARTLGPHRLRATLLVAFTPVLLVSEPQATNEVLFALLATAALATLAREDLTLRRGLAAGLFIGLALLTKYTGVLLLAGCLAGTLVAGTGAIPRRRLALAIAAAALALGLWPYLERMRLYGDPFIGNWDDALGHPYRQPPGFRIAAYFLRFGASLVAHPFRARETSLWDSLYASTFADGFGRMLSTPLQHALQPLLAWLALPLAVTALGGWLAVGLARERPGRLEAASLLAAILMVGAVAQFNLEVPYWSTAKGVFLLGLALPFGLAFERGRSEVVARGGRLWARLLDLDLALFAAVSALAFTCRG